MLRKRLVKPVSGVASLTISLAAIDLLAALPRAALAETPFSFASAIARPPSSSLELAGGVVTLKSPGTPILLIPDTTFTMGSTDAEIRSTTRACRERYGSIACATDAFENERALHQVRVSPYWIDRYEVTVFDYAQCVQTGRCDGAPLVNLDPSNRRSLEPIVGVTWEEARRYCASLRQRLPTEAEWERAARGMSGRRFPWGEHYASSWANHGSVGTSKLDASDGYDGIAPVGTYPQGRSADGLEDMAGNAAEWTADIYADGYEPRQVSDPKGPPFGPYRVVRGGSFIEAMPWLRGAARQGQVSSERANHIGFRCVRSTRLP